MARGYPDFEGDKSGLYLKPEWAAKERVDKNFTLLANGVGIAGLSTSSYVVPAGKTLYVVGAGLCICGFADADKDNNQIGWLYLRDVTAAVNLCGAGGNGGVSLVFNKPAVIPAGHQFDLNVYNMCNHLADIFAFAQGYEV